MLPQSPRKVTNTTPAIRPTDLDVSLTCIISKCMLVSNVMQQHGFQKKILCDTQLLSLALPGPEDQSSNPSQTDFIIMDFGNREHLLTSPNCSRLITGHLYQCACATRNGTNTIAFQLVHYLFSYCIISRIFFSFSPRLLTYPPLHFVVCRHS